MSYSHPTSSITSPLHSHYFDGVDFLSWTRNHPWSYPEPRQFVLNNGTQVEVWDTGVILFCPAAAEKIEVDLILSCGVHGNETAPIEICADLVEKLLAETIQCRQRVLFLFANPAAMNIGQRFVEENMNRLFSGAHSHGDVDNNERRRAAKLELYVKRFFEESGAMRIRRHYDLHTAIRASKNEKFAVYPYRHGRPWRTNEIQLLGQCGVKTILLSHGPTTTFSYFSSNQCDANAFTVELGQVKPFAQNDMRRFSQTSQTLSTMITEAPEILPKFIEADYDIYQVHRAINRQHEDFKLHFADDVPNFTDFPIGYLLATDADIEHKVECDGEAIIFPNADVALGQRALLTVVPTRLSE